MMTQVPSEQLPTRGSTDLFQQLLDDYRNEPEACDTMQQ